MATNCFIYFCVLVWISLFESALVAASPTSQAPALDYTRNITCDFESGSLCGLSDECQVRHWAIRNGTQFGGMKDHTTDSEYGHFLTTEGPPGGASDCKIWSPKFPFGPHCVELYVRTREEGVNEVSVMKVVENLEIPVYKSKSKLFKHWERVKLTILTPQPYEIGIVSQRSSGDIGQIFFDDVKITPGLCPLDPLSLINVTCDFEDNQRMCGFTPGTNLVTHEPDWTLTNDSAISDHTLGTHYGHCLISQIRSGDTNSTDPSVAFIQSPMYQGEGTHCLSFYYKMFAPNANRPNDQVGSIGQLRLYVVPEGQKASNASLVYEYWTNGNLREWVAVQSQYDINTKYRIVFESVSSPLMTIYLIDDLTVVNAECPKPTTTTDTPTTATTTASTPASTTTSTTSKTECVPTTVQVATEKDEKTETASNTPTTTTTIASTSISTTSTTEAAKVTVQVGKQVDEKTDRTWIYAVCAGLGLLVLIAIVLVFVTKRRKRNAQEREKKRNVLKRGISEDYQCQEYAQPTRPYRPKAFSNPYCDEPTFTCINPMFPVMEQQAQADV